MGREWRHASRRLVLAANCTQMYSGTNKYGGDIVGERSSSQSAPAVSAADAAQTASAEESLAVDVDGQRHFVTSRIDLANGELSWNVAENTKSVLQRTVAMSQMTSMLHDKRRNDAYETAIGHAVRSFRAKHNRAPLVLDIGSGTGLLSMMAAKAGASAVFGCEMFEHMAEIAGGVTGQAVATHQNDFGEPMCSIKIFPCKSSDLSVAGEAKGDVAGAILPQRADMLVTEIFDSVLLGEAVLPSLRHAFQHLLVEDAAIVPEHAVVYAQCVACPAIAASQSTHTLAAPAIPDAPSHGAPKAKQATALHIQTPAGVPCAAGCVPISWHVREIRPAYTVLSPALEVARFDFRQGSSNSFRTDAHERIESIHIQSSETHAIAEGHLDSVLLYWDLDLGGGATYSTRPDPALSWQDHWVQVMSPLQPTHRFDVKDEEGLVLHSMHDDYRFWFSCQKASEGVNEPTTVQPSHCTCGVHTLCNADRLLMLNDAARLKTLQTGARAMLDKAQGAGSGGGGGGDRALTIVDLGDGSIMSLILADSLKHRPVPGQPWVVSSETLPASLQLAQALVTQASLHPTVHITPLAPKDLTADTLARLSTEQGVGERRAIHAIMAEPFYYQMQNLDIWQALCFWYTRSALHPICAPQVAVCPAFANVTCSLVELSDLPTNFGHCGSVNGFDHTVYDEAAAGWSTHSFHFPLWMYQRKWLTAECPAMVFDFEKLAPGSAAAQQVMEEAARTEDYASVGSLVGIEGAEVGCVVETAGRVDAVVAWLDYGLDSDGTIGLATGSTDPHGTL